MKRARRGISVRVAEYAEAIRSYSSFAAAQAIDPQLADLAEDAEQDAELSLSLYFGHGSGFDDAQ